MLFGAKGGCQNCTCVPCDACTRTCTNPHSGGAFEAVYTRYFEGVEAGNPSDGYLSASGDSDTSDPYNGMDGTGPWSQAVGGSFTLDSTQTRFPCSVTVSFWRNSYALGAGTIPPASTALTGQSVSVTVSSGAILIGGRVIVPADGRVQITGLSIPLVSGGGDQSSNDPRRFDGTVQVAPQCESATFSIQATITWNTQKRQHVLYGRIRECYEEGAPCSCTLPNVYNDILYVEISGFTDEYNLGISPSEVNGIYVAEKVPYACDVWKYPFGVVQPGAVSFQTYPFSTTNYGLQTLRYYIWYGLFSMSVTGVSYTCGTGTMATQTVDITLWYQYEFGSQDLNAGTITIRVFK